MDDLSDDFKTVGIWLGHQEPKSDMDMDIVSSVENISRYAYDTINLTNKKHKCPEWDFLEIDKHSPEFGSCLCFKNIDIEKLKEQVLLHFQGSILDKRNKGENPYNPRGVTKLGEERGILICHVIDYLCEQDHIKTSPNNTEE